MLSCIWCCDTVVAARNGSRWCETPSSYNSRYICLDCLRGILATLKNEEHDEMIRVFKWFLQRELFRIYNF